MKLGEHIGVAVSGVVLTSPPQIDTMGGIFQAHVKGGPIRGQGVRNED